MAGKSIQEEHVKFLLDLVERGSTLMELGSGPGTGLLKEHFKVISVEDNTEWIQEGHTTVHAQLRNYAHGSWYDIDAIKSIPRDYDAILVDGPSSLATMGRFGFWMFLGMFRKDVPILIDDVNEELCRITMVLTSMTLRKPYEVHRTQTREFGVIR